MTIRFCHNHQHWPSLSVALTGLRRALSEFQGRCSVRDVHPSLGATWYKKGTLCSSFFSLIIQFEFCPLFFFLENSVFHSNSVRHLYSIAHTNPRLPAQSYSKMAKCVPKPFTLALLLLHREYWNALL
jgi:hypothetical protein